MRKYTTIAKIEDYLLIDIDAAFEARVNIWIEEVSKYIEQITGRVFIADATASVKKYDGNGKDEFFVDEIVSLAELKIDGVIIDSADYLLYPANEIPKTRIKLKKDIFTKGEQNIEVKAKWGYSVVCPIDISFAATILVAGIINFASKMEGEVRSERLADYTVTYKDKTSWQDLDRAKQILQNYKKVII